MDLEKFAKALNDKFGQVAEATDRGTIIIRNGELRLELDGYGNISEPAAPVEPEAPTTPGV